jgi:hypothetical protein
MVARKKLAGLSVLLAVLGMLFLALVPFVRAQGITYSVSQEWTKVWINTDSSVNILYNITFTYLSGSPQGLFDVGMPIGGFQVNYVEDLSGSSLQYQDISGGGYYGVEVSLKQPVVLNQPITFIVYATVPGMIYPDSTNPGYDGVQFFPSTLASASGSIADLRVEIVLPPGVQTSEVRSPAGLPFDNVFVDENRTAVYWNRTAWPPSQTFDSGVSFPEQYVVQLPSPSGTSPSTILSLVVPIIFIVVFLFAVASVVIVKSGHTLGGFVKAAYVNPRISIEALGANRSLTAVEAGLVMGLKPVRVLTMMLYGLLLKRTVAVVETDPLIKLKKLEKPEGETASAPRYYESDYLKAIQPDGTLDEKALARTYQGLVDTVNQKLRGYSREDTMNYYKSIVDKAWTQVAQAGTPELKGDALDKNLDWLLADEKFDDRFKTAFPPTMIIYPNPAWWWYWGGPRFPSGQKTTSQPPSQTVSPSAPIKTAPLPGQDFANNVVRGLQTASNNMVKNMQDFANKLIPFQTTPKEGSVAGKPTCVCACHACACACACVSCACACAGGGAR